MTPKFRPWIREGLVLAAVIVGVTALTLGVFRLLPFLATAEHWIEDYQVATLLPPEQHPDIVFVAITEETLEMFPYRSPVDRRYLAELLRTLEQRRTRAIVLDVLIDQPTEEDKDALLKAALNEMSVPLVVTYGRQEELMTDEQVAYLDEFVKPELRGFANLVSDGFDGTVRWIYPGRSLPDGTFVRGIAGALVEKLGVSPPTNVRSLAYRGRPDSDMPTFKEYPSHTVALLPAEWFEGKIVLIGADLGLTDRHRTPFAAGFGGPQGTLPGVKIHAQAIAQLLDGRAPPTGSPVRTAVAVALLALLGTILGRVEMPVTLRVVVGLAAVAALWIGGFFAFRYQGVLMPLLPPSMALGLGVWVTDVYTGRRERAQKKFISNVFSKYVSAQLLEEILRDPAKLSLDATRKEISILFTDVAGFTTISERMEAAELAALLNAYLDGACREVFKHGGTVNQFTGDAIYAMFNAPRDQPDHARRALSCALDIDAFSEQFIAEQAARGVEFGMTRIGVHTAVASVGNFGSRDRFEYKALGDAVNTASRLEGLNKYFGTRVLVSGGCAACCPDQPFRPLGHVVVKGRANPIDVFEPLDPSRAASTFMADYLRAYEAMERGAPESKAMFEALQRQDPNDGPVAFHLSRIRAGEISARVVMAEK